MPDPINPTEKFWFDLPAGPPLENQPEKLEGIEVELIKKILLQEKELHDTLYFLATIYSFTNRIGQAVETIKFLLLTTRDPEEKAHYCLSMGQLMERKGNYPAAIEFYSQAFALEPTNTTDWYYIHNNLGYSLNQLGRHAEAETYCRQAIQIDPQRFNAYKNLGLALEGLGRFADAVPCYIQATHANSGDERALGHLEDLLAGHPQLLEENPALVEELQRCRRAVKFACDAIDGMEGRKDA